MKTAVTGATGFVGRYILDELIAAGHQVRAWHRPDSNRAGLDRLPIDWTLGLLDDPSGFRSFVRGCDAVIHAALHRPGKGFRGVEGDVIPFLQTNLMGTVELIEAARKEEVPRFVFVSTCAVYDEILPDRPLDEAHPMWPRSIYGAHKAAIESLVHAYGLGYGYPICSLRPTGVYGLATPPDQSKWYDLVSRVLAGKTVDCRGGGKEVHARDVAKALLLLLQAEPSRVAGQSFNCCDRYISEWDVVELVQSLTGHRCRVNGTQTRPKNQIDTTKLRSLGFEFGGDALFRRTIEELVSSFHAFGRPAPIE